MAKIHGISGSTRYLLRGTKAINGKKLATFEEIDLFYQDYETILAKITELVGKQQDKQIADLQNEETQLDQQIKEGINQRTIDTCRHILTINEKSVASPDLLRRIFYTLNFWEAYILFSFRIQSPAFFPKIRLKYLNYRKIWAIDNKPYVIDKERRNVIDSHAFLKNNQPFLFGAKGEEYVISQLSGLPDEFHVLNDVNLIFQKHIYWKKYREYIRTCQIDHIVIGPTGLFLLETKNWTKSNMENNSDALIHQVNRANLALWYYLKDHYWRNDTPQIRKVIVSMYGFTPGQKSDPYIDAVTPDRLCEFITSRDEILSQDAIHKLILLIPCR
jgi:hypothetical protein